MAGEQRQHIPLEIYNPGAFPEGFLPEDFISGGERPIRRNPLITSALYYLKDVESFGTGLKRIVDACNESGCRYEFKILKSGFVVAFYRDVHLEGSTHQENHQENHQETLQEAILKFCAVPHSKKEIAEFCGYKDLRNFTIKHLNPLLKSGKLTMTIPDNPKNRNQK